jgi:hypothetical protein
MKLFSTVLLALALSSSFALAQTPVSKDQANSYFNNCVQTASKTEQRFSPDAQQMFCACTAARLTQFFSIEDMATMTDTTNPRARDAMNKMIVNIYAPCMEFPAQEYHMTQCMANPQVSRLPGNPQQLCQCASNGVAQHLKTNGAQMFQEILTRNPMIEDPMQALYDDPQFRSFAHTKLLGGLK